MKNCRSLTLIIKLKYKKNRKLTFNKIFSSSKNLIFSESDLIKTGKKLTLRFNATTKMTTIRFHREISSPFGEFHIVCVDVENIISWWFWAIFRIFLSLLVNPERRNNNKKRYLIWNKWWKEEIFFCWVKFDKRSLKLK